MKSRCSLLLIFAFATSANAMEETLDALADALYVASPNDTFQAQLTGTLDLEGLYHEENPPGLLFSTTSFSSTPASHS